MDANEYRGYVNAVLYGIDFVRELDEDAVRWLADSMIDQRHYPNPPAAYAGAIKAALAAGRLPAQTLGASKRYSERELLEFLARLDRHLDERRPWPRPAVLKLDVRRWSEFAAARPVARVAQTIDELTGRLNRGLDRVQIGGRARPVAILELRSGELVALLGPADPPDPVFTLLQPDPTDPDEVIAHFCECTGVPPERVTRWTGT